MYAQAVQLAGRRVLLAEDMPVNAEIMAMVLSMKEIEADLAVNGKIAVEPEMLYATLENLIK